MKFCRTISSVPPLVITPLQDTSIYKPNNCFLNVRSKVKKDGGKAVCGWLVFPPTYILQAVAHCVWQPENSRNFIDITPRRETKLLFIPDFDLKYEDKRIAGYCQSTVKDPRMHEIVEAMNRMDQLEVQYWVPSIQGFGKTAEYLALEKRVAELRISLASSPLQL